LLFFFQAEDGIRDRTVTGVQTCALPISEPRSRFLLVICVMVLMGLIGAQTFLNRAGAQKQEEKKVETTISNASPVATSAAATTKPSAEELKKKLTPQQYHVTQECGTEPPFNNAYWNNHAEGIYVDIV